MMTAKKSMGSAIIQKRNLVPSENGTRFSKQLITHGFTIRKLDSRIIKKKAKVIVAPAIPQAKKSCLAVTGRYYRLSMQSGSLLSFENRRSKMTKGSCTNKAQKTGF